MSDGQYLSLLGAIMAINSVGALTRLSGYITWFIGIYMMVPK